MLTGEGTRRAFQGLKMLCFYLCGGDLVVSAQKLTQRFSQGL